MTTTTTPSAERIEGVVQVLILIAVGLMAGAASFTHVHDWTMHNSPPNTDDWFGWANAVISELTPIAAGLEARRRARHEQPIDYPIAVLVASVVLSLAAQVAVAKPGITGWLISAVPAIAFMALVKLVTSRTPTTVATTTTGDTSSDDSSVAVPAVSEETIQPTFTTRPTTPSAPEPVTEAGMPAALVMSANLLAAQHHNTTGRPIDAATLAGRLGVDHTTAHRLLGTTPDIDQAPVRVNGHDPAKAVTQ